MSDSENEVGISNGELPLTRSIDNWSDNFFDRSLQRGALVSVHLQSSI